jgi:hypothetical protein
MDELERLAELKRTGVLTEKEFDKQKCLLLRKGKRSLWLTIPLALLGLFVALVGVASLADKHRSSGGVAEPLEQHYSVHDDAVPAPGVASEPANDDFDKNGLPKCDSPTALQSVKNAIKNSPSGRTGLFELMSLEGIKGPHSIGQGQEILCDGIASFNDGTTDVNFGYSFKKLPNGEYAVRTWSGTAP